MYVSIFGLSWPPRATRPALFPRSSWRHLAFGQHAAPHWVLVGSLWSLPAHTRLPCTSAVSSVGILEVLMVGDESCSSCQAKHFHVTWDMCCKRGTDSEVFWSSLWYGKLWIGPHGRSQDVFDLYQSMSVVAFAFLSEKPWSANWKEAVRSSTDALHQCLGTSNSMQSVIFDLQGASSWKDLFFYI